LLRCDQCAQPETPDWTTVSRRNGCRENVRGWRNSLLEAVRLFSAFDMKIRFFARPLAVTGTAKRCPARLPGAGLAIKRYRQ
jgi:hypothetical protein